MTRRPHEEFQRLRLDDPILRIREVARLIRCSRSQAHALVKDGQLAALRLAGTRLVRVRLSEVERYLSACASCKDAG